MLWMKPPATSDLSVSVSVSKNQSIKTPENFEASLGFSMHCTLISGPVHFDLARPEPWQIVAVQVLSRISWTPKDPQYSEYSAFEWQMQRDQGVLWLFRSRKVKDRSISCRLRFRQNLAVTSGSKHETLRVRLSKSPHRLDGALRMFISEQDPAWKTVACSSLWHFAGHKCLQSVSMIPCKCCKPATYKSARSVKNSVICVSGLFYTDASHFQSGLELIHWFFMVLACFLTPLQIPTPFAACSAPG